MFHQLTFNGFKPCDEKNCSIFTVHSFIVHSIAVGMLLGSATIFAGNPLSMDYKTSYTMGSTGWDMAHGVAVNSDGDVYITGHFSGTADLDPTNGSDIYISQGNSDVFVTKISSNGHYEWSKTVGGSGWDRGSSITIDDANNVYIAGEFTGNVDLDPSGSTDTHNSGSGSGTFLMKLNDADGFDWATALGGYFYIYGNTLIVDSNDGSSYVTGAFNGTVDFNPDGTSDMRTSAGGTDGFQAKIDDTGSVDWVRTFGGSGYDMGHTVAVDSDQNTYFMGHFVGTVDLDPTSGVDLHTSSSTTLTDIFITKIDSNGNYDNTMTFGGTSAEWVYSSAMDGNNNLFVMGLFRGSADLDPTSGVDMHTAKGSYDVYLIKLNSNGGYEWGRSIGGPIDFYNWGAMVTVDDYGNAYMTRCFITSMDFNPGTGTDTHTSAGGADIFITRINSNGDYGETVTMGGSNYDCSNAITVDNNDTITVVGNFYGTADFDPTPGIDNHTSAGDSDIFITQISQ